MRAAQTIKHAAMAAAVVAGGMAFANASMAQEPYKIFLSMSYIGNDWQAEAANMVKAMAAHESMRDRVDLQIQVAGPNAQRQIQQINSMVQAGADAIVVYPISPTALNNVVRNACDQGVLVIAYDGEISEPCAYNVSIDQLEAGRVTAEWLVEQLGGEGDIVVVTGVPGTSVDQLRTQAAMEVFEQHPGINVIAEAVGMWSQAVARTELSKILATNDWDSIDGLWMQVGCYTANAMQLEAGKTIEDLIPCAGEGANGGRIQMLPVGTEVEGANGAYAPMGAPRISYASPPYSGGLALKLAVSALDGNEIPRLTVLPLPVVTNDTIALCIEGTWEEMAAGCSAFLPSLVPNPGWFASIYSADTPEIGLAAALVGQPED